jgi:hypothetical protein
VEISVTTQAGRGVAGGVYDYYSALANNSGYDLVGADGGVFVFPIGQNLGFFGSLPGLGVRVSDIKGIVPTANDQGYFLVGADGGVFAFGNAPFENSLPGVGVRVSDIVGIVPTSNDQGYFLVGADGGVFAFGNAPSSDRSRALGSRQTTSSASPPIRRTPATGWCRQAAPSSHSVRRSTTARRRPMVRR